MRRSSLMAGCLPLLLACGSHPQDLEAGRGLLIADVRGAMTIEYEGEGTFYEYEMGRRPGTSEPLTEPGRAFNILSEGTGGSRGYDLRFFFRSARPEVGSYPLSPIDGKMGTFTAFFGDEGGSWRIRRQAFNSASGTVHVTSSSAERVEGRFRMTAFRYYAAVNGRVVFDRHPQRFPDEDYASQPWIEVEGTFTAVHKPPDPTVMASRR